jgi:hypothetical protein
MPPHTVNMDSNLLMNPYREAPRSLASEPMLDPAVEDTSPAKKWDGQAERRALDDLFTNARQYSSTQSYRDLMQFVARFRFYSPFNAMLIHTQMSGATYVAPAYRWSRDYRRVVKPAASPLVILQPMGPIMFVFDVGDTEPLPNAPPLPRNVEYPFEIRHGTIGLELDRTIENAKRDGIRITGHAAGSQSAGSIRHATGNSVLYFQTKSVPKPEHIRVPLRYELLLNSKLSAEARYATLVHELAHLYCGHLGTPNEKWWPDRRGGGKIEVEFEAESACYLVCTRLGLDNPSEEYLAGYVEANEKTPQISLDCVMKAAGLIESMGARRLLARKTNE